MMMDDAERYRWGWWLMKMMDEDCDGWLLWMKKDYEMMMMMLDDDNDNYDDDDDGEGWWWIMMIDHDVMVYDDDW